MGSLLPIEQDLGDAQDDTGRQRKHSLDGANTI
jgi:hypothetical protein